jgi:hypothetical protein
MGELREATLTEARDRWIEWSIRNVRPLRMDSQRDGPAKEEVADQDAYDHVDAYAPFVQQEELERMVEMGRMPDAELEAHKMELEAAEAEAEALVRTVKESLTRLVALADRSEQAYAELRVRGRLSDLDREFFFLGLLRTFAIDVARDALGHDAFHTGRKPTKREVHASMAASLGMPPLIAACLSLSGGNWPDAVDGIIAKRVRAKGKPPGVTVSEVIQAEKKAIELAGSRRR